MIMAPWTKNVNVTRPLRDDDPMEDCIGSGDIARRYNYSFPIFSDDEGKLFQRLSTFNVTPPHSLDWFLVDDLKIREPLTRYLNHLSLYDFATRDYDCYGELCMEMLCSFILDKKKHVMTCRFLGKEYTITLEMMNEVFGFSSPDGAITGKPADFDVGGAWKQLSGFNNWHSNGLQSGFVKDPVLVVLHKFIAYNVSGKGQANKVNGNEVYLLWTAQGNDKVCMASFIWGQMETITKHSSYHPSMSNVATGLARSLSVAIPQMNWRQLEMCSIGYHELKNGRLIEDMHTFMEWQKRECVSNYMNAEAANLLFAEGGLGGVSSHQVEENQGDNVYIRPSSGYDCLREDLKIFKKELFARLDKQATRLLNMDKRLKNVEEKLNSFNPSSSRDEHSTA